MFEQLPCTAIKSTQLQGEQLRDMLKKHGSFGALEVHLTKTHKKKRKLEKAGGWHTKMYLLNVGHWTKPLNFSQYHL